PRPGPARHSGVKRTAPDRGRGLRRRGEGVRPGDGVAPERRPLDGPGAPAHRRIGGREISPGGVEPETLIFGDVPTPLSTKAAHGARNNYEARSGHAPESNGHKKHEKTQKEERRRRAALDPSALL